jgi:hypothetical protein
MSSQQDLLTKAFLNDPGKILKILPKSLKNVKGFRQILTGFNFDIQRVVVKVDKDREILVCIPV